MRFLWLGLFCGAAAYLTGKLFVGIALFVGYIALHWLFASEYNEYSPISLWTIRRNKKIFFLIAVALYIFFVVPPAFHNLSAPTRYAFGVCANNITASVLLNARWVLMAFTALGLLWVVWHVYFDSVDDSIDDNLYRSWLVTFGGALTALVGLVMVTLGVLYQLHYAPVQDTGSCIFLLRQALWH